jgi:2-hydroxy-3-keto-5-methylthiopentenyl-1-phosphate phosphatase
MTRVARARAETSGQPRVDSVGGGRACSLVLDFDGTITMHDTLDLIVREFGDPEVRRMTEAALGKTLALHEVIARQYESVRTPLREVVAWAVENVRFRPGFRELVQLARERGWHLSIVSSGVREMIDPLLAREGMSGLTVAANSIDPDTSGWRVQFRAQDRCTVCGELCKRNVVRALAGPDLITYVGDGYSDGCAALAADRIFARRRLAFYLHERGVEFEPFENFFQVVDVLSGPTGGL